MTKCLSNQTEIRSQRGFLVYLMRDSCHLSVKYHQAQYLHGNLLLELLRKQSKRCKNFKGKSKGEDSISDYYAHKSYQ